MEFQLFRVPKFKNIHYGSALNGQEWNKKKISAIRWKLGKKQAEYGGVARVAREARLGEYIPYCLQ